MGDCDSLGYAQDGLYQLYEYSTRAGTAESAYEQGSTAACMKNTNP